MKILIAEDDFVSRTIMQEILSPYGSCHLTVDGREAIAAFTAALDKGDRYDLVCLDIMMPVLDGQEVLKEIRKIETERGIGRTELVKVIMTTALWDAKNIMKAFIRGQCEAYLVKPIIKENLVVQLQRLGLIKGEAE